MKHFLFSLLVFCPIIASAQPRVFAHRLGGRQESDENTLSALLSASSQGMTGFETDIRMTKDGVLVVNHDADFVRTCTTSGVIEQMTLDEVRRVRTKQGNAIMTLDELLDALQTVKVTYLEIEMKVTDTLAYPIERLQTYCDLLYRTVTARTWPTTTICFASFDFRSLRYMQQRYPEVLLAAITPKPVSEETINIALALGVKKLNATMDGSSRASIALAHAKGLQVTVWPGSKPEDSVLGYWLGADALCSDCPLAAKQYMAEHLSWVPFVF